MDDQKRADKKHRKLTRAPEVSQCDNSVPNVLQLSSSHEHHHPQHSHLSPTSGCVSPGQHQQVLPNSSSISFCGVHRNLSTTNVASLKDNDNASSITASASSLSFSSLLSSSASFFNHHHHPHPHPNTSNGNTNCQPTSSKSASTATAAATKACSSAALHPVSGRDGGRSGGGGSDGGGGCFPRDGKENILCGEECLKSTASFSPSPNSVSPAIPISNNTIIRGLEYFRSTTTNNHNNNNSSASSSPAANNASPSTDYYNANNNYVSCTLDSAAGDKEQTTSATNPQKQQQHLLIKPEETTLSPSSSTFSLKRFSSFSFNRGTRAKRNSSKEGRAPAAEDRHPNHNNNATSNCNQQQRSAVLNDAVSSPTTSSVTVVSSQAPSTTLTLKNDDGTATGSNGGGMKAVSPRRNKVSTNPFHQQSSSTSTSSSMSYQLSTDNVIDIIPACCLKVAPLHQQTGSVVGGGVGGCVVSTKESNDSASSDGGGVERSKVTSGSSGVSGGVSFVCTNCGIENRLLAGLLNEARQTRERLHVNPQHPPHLPSRHQEQHVSCASTIGDVSAPQVAPVLHHHPPQQQPRSNSPHTVQIQIKRNCPNQRDPSSDREDCLVAAAEDFGSFMSTNPFLSDTIKRDEFLKATMRICLVVSPPASKLQIKSRSLNHLDALNSIENGCKDGTKGSDESTESNKIPVQPQQQHQLQPHKGQTPAWEAVAPSTPFCCSSAGCLLNESDGLASSDFINGGAGGGLSGSSGVSVVGNMQKTSSIASFPRSPSSVSRGGYLSLTTVHSPNKLSCDSANQSPKGSGFLTSRRNNRKPLLVRSEASSSEYFTVRFEGEDDTYISGKRGVPLSYALGSVLQSRNLSFSQITVTDPIAEPGVPIDESTDVGDLVGRRLFVTENSSGAALSVSGSLKTKSSHHQLQKAASVGSRTKKLYSSVSTEETLESSHSPLLGVSGGAAFVGGSLGIGSTTDSSRIVKQHSKRWSTFLGIKNPHQNQLCELLNQYARNGVPQFQQGFTFNHHNLAAALEYLSNSHSSWTAFVNCTGMSDAETKIQSAIWELVTTEIYYIHALQTVTDLFLACLKAIQAENLLTDVDQNKLFSNIGELCETNLTFWTLYLFPMVQHSITTGHPMCIDFLVTGFTTFSQLFAPYTKYCAEQSTCQYYCRELNRNNCLFTAYLAWCEAHKKCNRLRLADILVRPMQRLTKYSLLLVAIRKHVQEDSTAEIMDGMIHSVEHFVCSVNSHLTMRQENERLKGIMARIESYDVVDSNNDALERMVKSYSNMFDLCGPIKGCAVSAGRHLFMEGDLKLKDSQGKMDVHCFLLTDILLICKAIAKKGHGTLKVIRQPYLTDKLKIILKDNSLHCLYLNDWDMAVAAFTLQCPEAKNWYESISKARRIYNTLKQGMQGLPETYTNVYSTPGPDLLGVRNSPRSVGSSHSGSVELNESRNISIDFEKTNSLSSDEGSTHGFQNKSKYSGNTITNQSSTNLYTFHLSANAAAVAAAKKSKAISSCTLDVKQDSVLRQSLPNLSLHSVNHSNMLLVPGAAAVTNSSGQNNLLSPSHRGISYPPPSPTRATLRRAYAISTSTKNPPLEKTRNIISQNSFVGVPAPAFSSSGSVGGVSGVVGGSTSATPCQALLDEYAASPVKESDV